MYLLKIVVLFVGLLLICDFYQINCQTTEQTEETTGSPDSPVPGPKGPKGPKGGAKEGKGPKKPKEELKEAKEEAKEAKEESKEAKEAKEPKEGEKEGNKKENAESESSGGDESGCKKICTKNMAKKFQSHCISHRHKSADKTKTREECMEKCKKNPDCESAVFVKPRAISTLDLKNLFDRVINHENWVSVKTEENLIEHFKLVKKGKRRHHHSKDSDDEPEEDVNSYGLVNPKALKSASDTLGTCYMFDEKLTSEEKLECNPSNRHFIYDDIECMEDPNCVRPRKQCTRGKCGPRCKDFNYIHLPNACLAKYYFGHQESANLESCLEFCLKNAECKSVDFGNMGSCLINYVTRNDSQLVIGCDNKNNEVWDYYEIVEDSECPHEKPRPSPNEDTCANVPGICKNGGFCEPIQNPPPHQSFTYGCQCPCNYCGKHCDKLNMKTYKNGCLKGSVMVWSVSENNGDCLDMCLNEHHCKSVSYSGTSGTCVLHWADSSTDPIVPAHQCPTYRSDIMEREWQFHEIICNTTTCHSSIEVIESKEMKGCASNPCLNGGECADIFQRGKLIGFHCHCKCGYCGDRCEAHNFKSTPDACIWGSHISDSPKDYYRSSVSMSTCFNTCAAKYPVCRSVDYSNKGECMLNNRDSDIATVSKNCNNYLRQKWTLYDLSCTCNNKPIVY